MLYGVEEHTRTHTVHAIFAHQDFVVHAAFAALPKLLIGGQLGVGYGFVAQLRIDFHHGQPCGQAKDFGVRIFFSR